MKVTNKIDAGRVVLVGVCTDNMQERECSVSLAELRRLVETSGGVNCAELVQCRERPDARTFIGSGKLKELAELCRNDTIDLAVFDCELTPSQIRNIENELDDVRVIDRTMLILDIFALHAVTAEGKLQVELAQLKYTAPRLTGKGTQMSRLGGGIGTRGPGESKLESDRRHIRRRIEALEAELRDIEGQRRTARSARDRSGIPKIAIVGYTNAGKSTLLNALTDAGIIAEDKLFATLDPTTRKFRLQNGESVLLTDTVGFIRRLPTHLIKAFRSTLDEVVFADILLIVVDASDSEYPDQLDITEKLLSDLGAGDKPFLIVFNKCDKEASDLIPPPITEDGKLRRSVCISAKNGVGFDALENEIIQMLHSGKSRVKFVFPNSKSGQIKLLYSSASVESVDYGPDNITVVATVDARIRGLLSEYDGGDVK